MTGRALIVQGDALRLPLPDESVDLIVTSPPYFALRAYGITCGMCEDVIASGGDPRTAYVPSWDDHVARCHREIGSEPTPAEFLEHLWQATAEMVRVLKPTGSIFVDLGDSYSSGQRYDSEMTFEDAAWLAGVVDSDGSVSILARRDRGNPQHDAMVVVSQKYRGVVDRIAEVAGIGNVRRDEGKDLWRWQVTGQQAARILERIWPWLILKRQQALAAVELMHSKQGAGRTGGRRRLLDRDVLAYRERLRQAVLTWNQGGQDDYDPALLPLPDLPRAGRWIPAKSLLLLPERYRVGCVDRLGLIARAVICWSKPNGLPESVVDRVRRSHEDWVHLVKQPRYYSAIDEVREPHRGVMPPPNPLGKLPGSVWTIPSEPLSLPGYFVTQDGTLRDFLAPSRGRPRARPSSNGHGLFDSDAFAELVGGEDAGAWRWLRASGIAASPWPQTDAGLQLRTAASHYAAFPSRWPEQLIKAFSPPGICLDCGQGRVPVVERSEAYRAHRAAIGMFGNELRHEGAGRRPPDAPPMEATILGYACACTPHTNHPGSGEPSGPDKRYGDYLPEAGYPEQAENTNGRGHTSLQNRPKVGPWREYHLERWQPPPTRPAVILDPFMGTGTVLGVARQLGRIGIGTDLSFPYCRAARYRVFQSDDFGKAAGRTWKERQGSLI